MPGKKEKFLTIRGRVVVAIAAKRPRETRTTDNEHNLRHTNKMIIQNKLLKQKERKKRHRKAHKLINTRRELEIMRDALLLFVYSTLCD